MTGRGVPDRHLAILAGGGDARSIPADGHAAELAPARQREELLARWNLPDRPAVAPDGHEPAVRKEREVRAVPRMSAVDAHQPFPGVHGPHLQPPAVAEEGEHLAVGAECQALDLVPGVRRAERSHAPARGRVPQHRPPLAEVRVDAEAGRDEGTVRAVLDARHPPRDLERADDLPGLQVHHTGAVAGGGDAIAAWIERRVFIAPSDRRQPLSRRRLEHPASAPVAGDEMCAVVVVHQTTDPLRRDVLGPHLGSCRLGHVPDAGRAVATAGEEPRAVRAEVHQRDQPAVTGEPHELFAAGRIPDPRRAVLRTGSDPGPSRLNETPNTSPECPAI